MEFGLFSNGERTNRVAADSYDEDLFEIQLADRLGFQFLDTGAFYRALAHKVQRTGVSADDPEAVARLARETRIRVSGSPLHYHVYLDDEDVSGVRRLDGRAGHLAR